MWPIRVVCVFLGFICASSCIPLTRYSAGKGEIQHALHNENDEVEDRIVGGSTTSIRSHPYQVAILLNGTFIASGIILNKNWVATVQSAVGRASPKDIKIRVGSNKVDRGRTVKVKHVIFHDKYDFRTLDNDIALLKLTTNLKYNKYIRHIDIANASLKPGQKVITSGWGQSVITRASNSFKQLTLSVVNKETCTEMYTGDPITDSMLCAYAPKVGPSWDDFGDVLVANRKACGLFSWSAGCDAGKFPAVYTDLVHLKPYIDSVLSNKSISKREADFDDEDVIDSETEMNIDNEGNIDDKEDQFVDSKDSMVDFKSNGIEYKKYSFDKNDEKKSKDLDNTKIDDGVNKEGGGVSLNKFDISLRNTQDNYYKNSDIDKNDEEDMNNDDHNEEDEHFDVYDHDKEEGNDDEEVPETFGERESEKDEGLFTDTDILEEDDIGIKNQLKLQKRNVKINFDMENDFNSLRNTQDNNFENSEEIKDDNDERFVKDDDEEVPETFKDSESVKDEGLFKSTDTHSTVLKEDNINVDKQSKLQQRNEKINFDQENDFNSLRNTEDNNFENSEEIKDDNDERFIIDDDEEVQETFKDSESVKDEGLLKSTDTHSTVLKEDNINVEQPKLQKRNEKINVDAEENVNAEIEEAKGYLEKLYDNIDNFKHFDEINDETEMLERSKGFFEKTYDEVYISNKL